MARKNNLIKSKSLYTLRKKHQETTDGTIYENDHVTILRNSDLYDDTMHLYADSNFKFKIRTNANTKKKHIRGQWQKPSDSATTDYWTLSDITISAKTDESRIITKPNYSSLRDFAYYGSAVELIRATVNDIILRFPAGIYLKTNIDSSATITIDNVTYYPVSNEYNIDCWTEPSIAVSEVKNPLRVLSTSYTQYRDADGNEISQPIVSAESATCRETILGKTDLGIGRDDIYIYLDENGNNKLVTTTSATEFTVLIKPCQDVIDEFWNSIDDFERVLLDRSSKPRYKAVFETPFSTDNGYYYENLAYIWPTVEGTDDGFTPDVSSIRYQGYLTSLIGLAEFHDSYDSDNLWRMMTHESIKNLDWTFINNNDNESVETGIDPTRIEAMIHIYGRQFDDLKRDISNIKSTNSISYDEKNNTPDYFLTDTVENDGWIAQNTAPSNDESDISDIIYTGSTCSGYTPSETNINFQRRMAINSDYIQSMKGTVKGLKAVLGLFGYECVDGILMQDSGHTYTESAGTYTISEYVAIANKFPSYSLLSDIKNYGEYIYYDREFEYMADYPVIKVTTDDTDTEGYAIPWYDVTREYKYPMYFQEKGGWGRTAEKSIYLPSITEITKIYETNNTKLHRETESYIRYANNIDELVAIPNTEAEENLVCYVTDLYGMETYYSAATYDTSTDYSHYFILKNAALSPFLGYVNNDSYSCYGWKNVYEHEFNGESGATPTDDGTRVLYLESLETENKGNNPHIGKGKYDDGLSYLTRYNRIFEKAVEEGLYDEYKDSESSSAKSIYTSAATIGFNISGLTIDNKKCYFFKDEVSNQDNLIVIGDEVITSAETYNTVVPEQELAKHSGLTNKDESAANSVINVKNLHINFGTEGNQYLQDYIKNVVLKYLEEMIPSTTIVEYSFDNSESNFITGDYILSRAFVSDRMQADMALADVDGESTYTHNGGIYKEGEVNWE